MNFDRLKELKELRKRKRNCESELRDIEHNINRIHDSVLEDMINEGIQNINIDGETLYISSRIWAKYENREEACKALKAANMGDIVKEGFNYITLSALLSEYSRAGQDLPKEFEGIIEIKEVFSVLSRKT